MRLRTRAVDIFLDRFHADGATVAASTPGLFELVTANCTWARLNGWFENLRSCVEAVVVLAVIVMVSSLWSSHECRHRWIDCIFHGRQSRGCILFRQSRYCDGEIEIATEIEK